MQQLNRQRAGRGAPRSRRCRTVIVAAAAVAALAAAAGCGGSGGSGGSGGTSAATSTTAAAAPKLGYATNFLSDPFIALLQRQTIQAAKQGGLDPLAPTNANSDPGQQAIDVRNLIAAGAKGLIVVPVDADAIVPALNFASGKHVPVVTIDQGPNGGKVAMIVRADNKKMGELACEQVGRGIGGRGKVLELQGDLSSLNGRDRSDGFEECLKAKYPNVQLIARQTDWKAEKAANIAQTVLTANSDLSAIYMASDSVMLQSVLQVLKTSGHDAPVGKPNHIFLVSVDGTPLALQAIRDGNEDAVISQPLDLYVKYGVQYAREAIEGQTFKPGPTDHGSTIVEYKGNLMEALPATLVTRANASDPQLWGNQAH